MKYQISAEQRHFFENKHYIEFEGLLSIDECKKLQMAAKKVNRDLARHSDEAKKILFQPKFSQIASELSMQPVLRYGFDELYSAPKKAILDTSCVRGIAFLMMLCIEGQKAGNIAFFLPEVAVDAQFLFQQEEGKFLLFAWAERTALYCFNAEDPHTHELKKIGYVFGDRLKEQSHPTLWR